MTLFGLYVRVIFVLALGAVTWVTLDMVKKVKTQRAAEEAEGDRKAREILDSIPNLHAPPAPPVPEPAPGATSKPPEAPYADRTAAALPVTMPIARIPPPSTYAVAGRVFDLRSLRPVPDAVIEFSASAHAMRARADARGRYVVYIAKAVPHTVTVDTPGYARFPLHEPDIPYKRLPAAERERLIRAAASEDLARTQIIDDGGDSLPLDVFVAPLD